LIDVNCSAVQDIVGAVTTDGAVRWWETTSGAAQSWTQRVIRSGITGVSCAVAVDLDLDGDIDVGD
jgi:hypothetical protein